MRVFFDRCVILFAILSLSGCGSGSDPSRASGKPNSGVSQSCERLCNGEYDACNDRFAGVGAAGTIDRRSDDPASALGPNDICPDQLKSCMHRCSP